MEYLNFEGDKFADTLFSPSFAFGGLGRKPQKKNIKLHQITVDVVQLHSEVAANPVQLGL